MQKTFGSMVDALKSFPGFNVTPPLRLKDLGQSEHRFVLLSEGTPLNLNLDPFLCT